MPYDETGQSAPPSTVMIVPFVPPAPEPPPPPPPPARPVMHEYHWPNTNQSETAAAFSIVTKDNAVHYATMVWSEGDKLHYIDQEGGSGQLARASISRELTYRANAGKNIKAWLP